MLSKFCVFCGEKPKGKDKEHIIPHWLLELTGKPTRSVVLGIDWRNTANPWTKRRFGYSSFTFPACRNCNGEFSDLERRSKEIIVDMLGTRPISASGLDTLLDWLDKIRVGIWLGLMYLNSNIHGIKPMFFIKQRLAAHDRMVVIYRDTDPARGVAWGGADSPIFHIMPSCMTLVINQLHFFNASSPMLFSPRMGFPGPGELVQAPAGEQRVCARLKAGTGQIELPLVRYSIYPSGTQLYQPMIPRSPVTNPGYVQQYYDNEYVRARCMDYPAGKGKVFQLREGALGEYPAVPSFNWVPPLVIDKQHLMRHLPRLAMDWLEAILADHSPSQDQLCPERGGVVFQHRDMCVKLHRMMVQAEEQFHQSRFT